MNPNIDSALFIDTSCNMPCYKVSKEDLEQTELEFNSRFPNDNIMNSNTVYNRKESRLAGILGEIVFSNIYPNAQKPKNDLTYDFDYNNFKLDVKCKYRTVKPNLEFEASFFLYQSTEKFHANMYYFMSTVPSLSHVWLCGYITKKGIMENPNMRIWRAGEVDDNNGMTFRKDTVCLKYKYLEPATIE